MKTIIIAIFLSLFAINPLIMYFYNKTYWKGQTDCMIEYVNKYYPNGSEYLIYNKLPHIDWKNQENKYMVKTWDVNGCIMNSSWNSLLVNTPYCYWTLILETKL